MKVVKDPILHSHIEDILPDGHPLAYENVYCKCGRMLHCANNECMATWIETGQGAFCISCFASLKDVAALGHEFGLPP